MLCTPDRLLAVNNDLAFEDTIGSLLGGLGHLLTGFLIDNAKFRFAKCDVAKQGHHTDHGVVIKRDVPMVTISTRIVLRPSAVFVLGFQKERDASEGCLLIAFIPPHDIGPCQVANLVVRGDVVDSGIVPLLLTQQRQTIESDTVKQSESCSLLSQLLILAPSFCQNPCADRRYREEMTKSTEISAQFLRKEVSDVTQISNLLIHALDP